MQSNHASSLYALSIGVPTGGGFGFFYRIFDSNTVTLCTSQAAEKKSVDVHLDRSVATALAPASIITQLKGTVSSSDVG